MDLKRIKAEGCDGVVNEHLIFGDCAPVLTVYCNVASQFRSKRFLQWNCCFTAEK